GIYCVVFGLSTHALFCHGSSTHTFYKGGSITLFVLATVYTGVYSWGTTHQALIEFDAAKTKSYASLIQYLRGNDMNL
ncbi:hypothetical protein L218DRAFT_832973, partial [Marasmius fiardii PR-910]